MVLLLHLLRVFYTVIIFYNNFKFFFSLWVLPLICDMITPVSRNELCPDTGIMNEKQERITIYDKTGNFRYGRSDV